MSLETDFLEAVSRNDVDEVARILDVYGGMINLQCRDNESRTPLIIAIQEGYLDVINVLLRHNVYIGDALLMAVEVQFVGAVKTLCRYAETEKVKEIGKDFVNSFPTSVNFPPGSSPLQMASIQNDYTLVKILLDYDARMPNLKVVLTRINDDSFEKALVQLHWYQAISSEAYLLLASEDPMDAAFWLAKKLRMLSISVIQLKEEYDELSDNLEQFVTRLLGFARNLDEIEAVLGAQRFVTDPNAEIFATHNALPVRLQEAVKFGFKKFVAHSTCQDYMLSRWYSGSDKTWRKLSSFKMAAISSLVIFAWPILCLFFILLPSGRIVEFVRTPYVRFLLHTGSRLSFIILLGVPVTSLELQVFSINQDSATTSYIVQKALKFRDVLPWLVNIWIVGMTWREVKQVWGNGIRIYCKNFWNLLHSFQLVFYWIYLVLGLVSYAKAGNTIFQMIQHSEEETAGLPTMVRLDSGDRLPEPCLLTANNTIVDPIMFVSPKGVTFSAPFDPIFVAEAAFAVANVLTQLSLLNAMVAISLVGPLHISMGNMMQDVGRFMLLFGIVLGAFSLGMAQVYQTNEMLIQKTCANGAVCEGHAFGSYWRSVESLFWSVFDLMDLDKLKVTHDLVITEAIGTFLYACYCVVGVVVLMNALIAMMSNTYTRVEENSDVEWKVARTRLMTEYLSESATIPPPLNMVPSTRAIKRLYGWVVGSIRSSHPKHRRREAGRRFQHDVYKHIVKKLVQRFLWQEKVLRARMKHRDKVQTALSHIKDAVEMARSDSSKKRRLCNTFSTASRRDPYLRQFYKQKPNGDACNSAFAEERETHF